MSTDRLKAANRSRRPGSLARLLMRARVRTPTILQMEAVECGAAALAIILAWHGRHIPLEELRIACGVSRNGSKAGNLLRAARSHGMSAQGMRLEINLLENEIFPVIVFWNFNHFLVVDGFDDQCVYLNDPASGPRTVTAEEFSKSYTGITLRFEPGPRFQKCGRRRGLTQAIGPRLDGAGSAFGFIFLASLALVIPGVAIPAFGQVFVDEYLIGRVDGWIRPLLLGMAITAVLRSALTWLQQSCLLRLEMRLSMSASAAFFWHVLRLPVEFFDRRHAADIVQRVGLNDRIAQILCGELATNAVAMITLIFYVMVMLSYDWALTLIGVALTGVNAVALKAIGRQRADRNMTLQLDRARLMTTVIGGIQAIETIKAGGGEHDFFRRWTGQKAVVSNTEHGLDATANLLAALPLLLSALVTAVILGLGGVHVMTGDFTIGMLVAFLGLMAAFSRPVKNLMGITGKFQEAQAILGGLDDVLRAPLDPRFTGPDPQPDGNVGKPGKAAKLQGYLKIHDASFGYDRLEPPLIEHFSLTLAPGQRVALVGESGSGKSTVAKMVMGLHAPWSGEILFDGVARERIAPDALNASVAGVDQEIHLFEGTVRDNLTLWDSALPEADMVQAAHDAMIHDTIAARGAGYDSAVGEGGANFSGGQRQRLEIARALATNPRMLVLDEATSALDPVTEKLIDDRLRRRGCTCLVVAHRLSTIRDCDEIIVMKAGKIVERGTHDVLMRMNGAYRSLAGEDLA